MLEATAGMDLVSRHMRQPITLAGLAHLPVDGSF
jgi:hypothetical protein